ncbi:MAG: DUF2889 domain-containing protein [Steroidobacteraceae bacterium]|jgi:hypothetical protein|nr:DUF2889 domain-containing protein [Steroidobacteraceae bacterium]
MSRPNPSYGQGVFRRRVRITVRANEAHVDLEDANHAFRLALRHDGERITALEPEFVRHPFTTCPESGRHLAALVGRPLEELRRLRRAVETRLSCTHVMDMTALALAHVGEREFARLYDVAVEDERAGCTHARVVCDGRPVHEWVIARHMIVQPSALAGRPMMQGFHAWARDSFADREFEAALTLQRGYFVAQARRYDTSPERDHPAVRDNMPDGVCYSYSAPVVQRALRVEGSKRDFTHDAEALLRFER